MLWTFRESSKASIALLYIVFCEILPFCVLATAYMLWFVTHILTFGLIAIPFLFCGTAISGTVNHIHEAIDHFPMWLGQTMGLSTLMTSPFDRNYVDRYRKFRAEQESLRYEPAPLPRIRKRRLSDGRQAPQMSSSFLKRLPLEIRQTIYKEVVVCGSEHRHIIELPSRAPDCKRKRNHLWGASCVKLTESNCWTGLIVGNGGDLCKDDYILREYSFKPQRSGCGALGLAKTCRQIYVEMIDIFYGSSD